MAKKYVAVFDSGLGGLTVVKALLSSLPEENIIFYGDSKNMPYGIKSKDEIVKLAIKDINFLKNFELKAILVGCNTVDSNAFDVIKNMVNVPIFSIIEPTCKKAALVTKNKKIAVMATPACIKTSAYQNKIKEIDQNIDVTAIPCKGLTELIEAGKIDDDETRNLLNSFLIEAKDKQCDTIILGCTHYPLVSKEIKKIIPNVTLISSSQEVVNSALNNFEHNNKKGESLYYVSSLNADFENQAKSLIGKNIDIKEVKE